MFSNDVDLQNHEPGTRALDNMISGSLVPLAFWAQALALAPWSLGPHWPRLLATAAAAVCGLRAEGKDAACDPGRSGETGSKTRSPSALLSLFGGEGSPCQNGRQEKNSVVPLF